MNLNYLDFEQPIAELEDKIDALESVKDDADIAKEMDSLKLKSELLTKKIFTSLSDWQISQLARHPQRLYTLDYIENIFDEFTELHGDRAFANDYSLVVGIAKIDGFDFMFIGQQKGRSTKEKIFHNFGMTRPEGYRKALRLMKLAEKFSLPIISFSYISSDRKYNTFKSIFFHYRKSICINRFIPIIKCYFNMIIFNSGIIYICNKFNMLFESIRMNRIQSNMKI